MRKVLRLFVCVVVFATILAAAIPLYNHNPAEDESFFPEVGQFVEEHVTFIDVEHLRTIRDWLKSVPERF